MERVLSLEEALSRQKPRWRYENLVECEDSEGCPEVAHEDPNKVHWAPVSEVDAAIGRSLMADRVDEGGELQSAPQSGGSVVVKRYVFAGQVVAMQHNGELFFLRPDHLGSASLIQDDTGRWLADHRFYPYGETRRSDGASESYPTDKLFTGMLLNSYIKLTRMGARWYDNELGRWISPDSIIPDPANPQSLNRYAYVWNRPLVAIDPSGHYGEEVHELFTYRTTYETAKTHLTQRYGLSADLAHSHAVSLASRVAAANQGTDCKLCIRDNSAIPGFGQIHWRSLDRAWEEVGEASKGSPEQFGRALHGLQDYYAHRRNGFTGPPAPFGGAVMYLADIVLGDEKFNWDTFKESFGWGHAFASNRDLADWETPLPGDPDYINFQNLTESDEYMINDTEYWVLVYVRWYFEANPDQLRLLDQDDSTH